MGDAPPSVWSCIFSQVIASTKALAETAWVAKASGVKVGVTFHCMTGKTMAGSDGRAQKMDLMLGSPLLVK